MLRSPLSDAAGGLAEDPPCLFALSAWTIHDLGIRDCSSARKSPLTKNTFGPFAFGSRSHACGADLALFSLAIDSKLRACDLVKLRVDEVCSGARIRDRATVVQKKTGRPVQFEITDQTKASLEVWLRTLRATGTRYLFPSRLHARPHLSTRQYARLVHRWVDSIGLETIFYGTHSMRRTKVTQIYRKTGNLRAVQLLLGHTKLESTVRYLGIEVDDALHIAEQIEL
jgi:integrase